jgi:hypothetical protein
LHTLDAHWLFGSGDDAVEIAPGADRKKRLRSAELSDFISYARDGEKISSTADWFVLLLIMLRNFAPVWVPAVVNYLLRSRLMRGDKKLVGCRIPLTNT